MSHWTDYRELAARQTAEQFAADAPDRFLLKRPRATPTVSAPPANISFKTTFARSQVDPFANEWVLLPVEKRAGNPYPDRLSIGRATNCDIVLRVPFVSKVQAHLLKQADGSFAVQDNQAANPTHLNWRPLSPHEPHPIALGDVISFGPMDFELIDPSRLHALLRGELGSHR